MTKTIFGVFYDEDQDTDIYYLFAALRENNYVVDIKDLKKCNSEQELVEYVGKYRN